MSGLGPLGLWTMAIACGVMAGVYLTFSSFVMTSLKAVPPPAGIAAMQAITRVILSSLFMPLFFASSAASVGYAVWGIVAWGQPGTALWAGGGLVYFVGMFLCTATQNVPLNRALDAVDPGAAGGPPRLATLSPPLDPLEPCADGL